MSSPSPASDRQARLIASVRQWVILLVGVLIILYSLTSTAPAALMVGVSMVGGVPLDLAQPGRVKDDRAP